VGAAVLYVVIPALNEAPNLEHLFADLNRVRQTLSDRFTVRVVLVDDGSTDGTGERAYSLADGLDVTVARHASPQGPGRAFGTGFTAIAPVLEDDDYVLTLEADNTSRLDLLELMMHRSREGHDAIFASPYTYGGGIVGTTRWRILLSHIANSFVKSLLDIRGIHTVSSFYRLYQGRAIRRLQRRYGAGIVECSGFDCMVELALKTIYLQMTISEVPMVLDASLRIGRSKMRVVRTGFRYLRLFVSKRRWRRHANVPAVMWINSAIELNAESPRLVPSVESATSGTRPDEGLALGRRR
jgi:glycosyltransferase involved in cell wall biosynthesis